MANYNLILLKLENRLETALDTDTDNPIYEEHTVRIIRDLLSSIETTKRIKREKDFDDSVQFVSHR